MARKLRMTAIAVARLKGEAKRYRVHDVQVAGLCLAVSPSGGKSWYHYRWVDGKPSNRQLGQYPALSLKDARTEAARLNAELAAGRLGRPQTITWGDLHAEYVEDAKGRIASWNDAVSLNRCHLTEWQRWPIRKITHEVLTRTHARVGQEHQTAANRLVAMVSGVFKFARSHGLIGRDVENPAVGIRKFREQSRKRFLSGDELVRFFDAAEWLALDNPVFADFFRMLLFTGQRAGKVRAMAWADIDLEQRTWRIAVNKNGDTLTVHLSEPVLEILSRASRELPFVFPSPAKSGHIMEPKGPWKILCKRAGFSDLRMHDLRHTLASWQAIDGVSLPIIGASLGHKSQQSTARYAHLSLDPVRASVDAAAAKMLGGKAKPAGDRPDGLSNAEWEVIRKMRSK